LKGTLAAIPANEETVTKSGLTTPIALTAERCASHLTAELDCG
jgi:hypothetical protein